MDWPRPQPESSYLWDQVPQLRCYLYDPTSTHISASLSRSPAFSSLPSRFSFSPSFSFALPLPPIALPVALLLSSFVPALYFASPFHFHPVPRYLSSARYILPPFALLATCQPLVLLQFESYLPARRPLMLSRLPDRRTSISAKQPSRICATACSRSRAR